VEPAACLEFVAVDAAAYVVPACYPGLPACHTGLPAGGTSIRASPGSSYLCTGHCRAFICAIAVGARSKPVAALSVCLIFSSLLDQATLQCSALPVHAVSSDQKLDHIYDMLWTPQPPLPRWLRCGWCLKIAIRSTPCSSLLGKGRPYKCAPLSFCTSRCLLMMTDFCQTSARPLCVFGWRSAWRIHFPEAWSSRRVACFRGVYCIQFQDHRVRTQAQAPMHLTSLVRTGGQSVA